MALVLTRRVGESVQIGPDVRISVAGVKGNQVRLAIEAPASTRIMREELLERDGRPAAPADPVPLLHDVRCLIPFGVCSCGAQAARDRR